MNTQAERQAMLFAALLVRLAEKTGLFNSDSFLELSEKDLIALYETLQEVRKL